MNRPFPLALGLLAVACAPSVGSGEIDAGPPDGDDSAAEPGDDGGDDGGDEDDGDDTDVEDVPGFDTQVRFSPPGGGFQGSVSVALSTASGAGEIWACTADPRETDCTLQRIDGAITIDENAVLHAHVRIDGVDGPAQAQAYYAVADDVADFSSDLPVLVFWTGGRLPESKTDPRPVALTVLEPDGGRTALLSTGADSGRARIRIRGSSSQDFPKPSWDLELWEPGSDDDREVELLGMPADADWVLYGPSLYDDALMRNALAYETSNAVGRWASRTRFVEVFAAPYGAPVSAAHYMGVYDVVEEIERGGDRVDVARLDPDDVTAPDVTGGYIFKRDREDEDDAGLWCGGARGRIYFDVAIQAVDPEEHQLADAQLAYLEAECDALGEASLGPSWTDPTSGRHYSEIIDVDSFIDHHILNVIFKNPDAFRLSGYYHKDREGLIAAGPVWDFDRACDSSDQRAWDPTWWDASNFTSDTTYVFDYGWYGGLMDDPAFAAAYWARWSELLDGPLSKSAMDARIVRMAGELDEAADRNHARWGGDAFDAEIASLRGWMAARHDWISACIATYPDPRDCPGQ